LLGELLGVVDEELLVKLQPVAIAEQVKVVEQEAPVGQTYLDVQERAVPVLQSEGALELEPPVDEMLVEVILVEAMLVFDGMLAVDSRFVDLGSPGSRTISGVPSTPIAKGTNGGKLNFVPHPKRDLKIGPINP
jgi:hypothetical protein